MVDVEALAKDVLEANNSFTSQKISTWKGYRLPVHFAEENIRYAMEEWKWPEKAIFIVTFPKCGTTWTNEIVRNILYGRDKELNAIDKALKYPFQMIGIGQHDKMFQLYDSIPLPRKYFATHVPEELFNFEKMRKVKGKVIFVMRNPKDQLVSWYDFTKILPCDEDYRRSLFSPTWNEFFEQNIAGEHAMYSKEGEAWPYPIYMKPWLKHKDDSDVLIISYEDMIMDTKKEVQKIANFIEVPLKEEDVDDIVQKTSLEQMQQGVKKPGGFTAVINKGKVGRWKDRFTVAQSERMDKLIEEAFRDTNVQFTFE